MNGHKGYPGSEQKFVNHIVLFDVGFESATLGIVESIVTNT